MRASLAVLAVLTLVAPCYAGIRTGYSAIAAGDLQRAETTLTAERRIFPDRPELMLNLAAIYGRTDRADAARALYNEVLAKPEVSMLMPAGAVESSHDVAQRGIARLEPSVVATR